MFGRIKYLCLCGFSLCIGFLVYLIFKETSYIHLLAEHWIGIPFGVDTNSAFINGHLCDYLWALSLTCGLIFVVGDAFWQKILCGSIAAGHGALWEGLQYFHAVPGTGDMLDILFYLAAGATAVFIFPIRRGKNEKGC